MNGGGDVWINENRFRILRQLGEGGFAYVYLVKETPNDSPAGGLANKLKDFSHLSGIDLSQPGFRPAERVEETGRRLEKYCKKFKVPFDYNSQEDPNRLMFEKGLYGRDAINVIACEGAERVERPETYKNWQYGLNNGCY